MELKHRSRHLSPLLLRAQVKPMEEMGAGVLCCEKMKAQLLAWALGNHEVKIVAGRQKRNCKCLACGAKFVGVPIAGLKGWYVDPRAWEIEEAPAQ